MVWNCISDFSVFVMGFLLLRWCPCIQARQARDLWGVSLRGCCCVSCLFVHSLKLVVLDTDMSWTWLNNVKDQDPGKLFQWLLGAKDLSFRVAKSCSTPTLKNPPLISSSCASRPRQLDSHELAIGYFVAPLLPHYVSFCHSRFHWQNGMTIWRIPMSTSTEKQNAPAPGSTATTSHFGCFKISTSLLVISCYLMNWWISVDHLLLPKSRFFCRLNLHRC